MHSHFRLTADQKFVRVFTLDECENCGAAVEAANAWTSPLSEVLKLRKLGARLYRGPRPAQEHYSEELEGCACEHCEG